MFIVNLILIIQKWYTWWNKNELTVNNKSSRLFDDDRACSCLSNRSSVLEPTDGRLWSSRCLAWQDRDRVDWQGLVCRSHGDDWRWLILDGCHLQVSFGHGRSSHAQCWANVEAVVLFSNTLWGEKKHACLRTT